MSSTGIRGLSGLPAIKVAVAALAILALSCGTAAACSFEPDKRPWATRVSEAPVVFVGTVTGYVDQAGRISGASEGRCGDDPLVPCGIVPSVLAADAVVFEIESAIRGVSEESLHVPQGQGTDCRQIFEIGQRWLFAGTSVGSPSVLLDGKDEGEIRRLVEQAAAAGR